MKTPNAILARFYRAITRSPRVASRSGATLVELAVCVLIIGLITIASLDFRKQVSRAKVASVASTARAINELAVLIYNTTGSWPADCEEGVCPPEMSTHLQGSLFSNETPIGGQWDWNGPDSDVPGGIGISVRFDAKKTIDQKLLADLDRLIDDNNLATGSCRQITHNGRAVYVFSTAFE